MKTFYQQMIILKIILIIFGLLTYASGSLIFASNASGTQPLELIASQVTEIGISQQLQNTGQPTTKQEIIMPDLKSDQAADLFTFTSDQTFLAQLKKDSKSVMCVIPQSVKARYHHTIDRLPCGFELQADTYEQALRPAKPRPALVFMHDWAGGKQPKVCGERQCSFLALTENIFCAALYYRQPAEGRYPAALQDLKTCLRWLRSVADDYAIDPDKIAVMGSSAGTQWTWLAAAGVDSPPSGGYAEFSSAVNLAVINAGICDFVKDFGDRGIIGKAVIGGSMAEFPEKYAAASPFHQVRAGMPPILMLHGDQDTSCPFASAQAMVNKLEELKVPVTFVVREGRGHGIGGFGSDLYDNLEVIRGFIKEKFDL